ncbi:MAG: hypothetical protein Q8R40_01150 [bacterium]|nr:hypothetical protein [bacterium]
MTLTTHSIIAAAVTKPLAAAHPVFIIIAAIASHYLSDAIPHWDYRLGSIEDIEDSSKRHWGNNRRAIMKDVQHFALDGFLGAALVLLVIRPVTMQQWIWALCAIIGGCLPDFLQGLYMLKLSFLRPIQKFHDLMHAKIRLGPYPRFGIPFQVLIYMTALYFLF